MEVHVVLYCVLSFVSCMLASQSLDLAGSRGHTMDDHNVQLVPLMVLTAAFGDFLLGEVFHSWNFCLDSCAQTCFYKFL